MEKRIAKLEGEVEALRLVVKDLLIDFEERKARSRGTLSPEQ